MKRKETILLVLVILFMYIAGILVFVMSNKCCRLSCDSFVAIGTMMTALCSVCTLWFSVRNIKQSTDTYVIKEAFDKLYHDKDSIDPDVMSQILKDISAKFKDDQSEEIDALIKIVNLYDSSPIQKNNKSILGTIFADIYTCQHLIANSHLSDKEKQSWFMMLRNLPQDLLTCHLISVFQIKLTELADKKGWNEFMKLMNSSPEILNYKKYDMYGRLEWCNSRIVDILLNYLKQCFLP